MELIKEKETFFSFPHVQKSNIIQSYELIINYIYFCLKQANFVFILNTLHEIHNILAVQL